MRVSGLVAATFLFAMLLRQTAHLYVRLAEALEDVSQLNASLESRIADRTRSLEAANASLRATVAERDLLLREVYHRVNNNLQNLVALLRLERRNLADAAARAASDRMIRRAQAMGLVHQELTGAGDMQSLDIETFAQRLAGRLRKTLDLERRGIDLVVEVRHGVIELERAVSLGLLLNELISEAAEAAGGQRGRIRLRILDGRRRRLLLIRGEGAAARADRDETRERIVGALVAQLGGRQRRGPEGTADRIVAFPLEQEDGP
jgi:two-component sensor histidine kinase